MNLARALLMLAVVAPGLAWGQAADQPERIARLAYVEGDAGFQAADERESSALPDRPLEPGDRVHTGRGRAEIAIGTGTIRLDEQSDLAIVDLDAATVRVELMRGTASVNLDELLDNETFEILTPNTAVTLEGPGEYRADVLDDDSTAVTVRGGSATVDAGDSPVRVSAGQRVRLDGRNAQARLESLPPPDAFDNWALEREVQVAEAEPARYTPYEADEYANDSYQELDRYGEWYDEPNYGRVWMPSYGYSGWSPYGGGYWDRVGYGWGWYDPAPFGFFTYYSGRWTWLRDRNRWCWVPARPVRPVPMSPSDVGRYNRLHAVRPGDLPTRVTPETAPRTVGQRSVVMTPSSTSAPRRNDAERRPARVRMDAAGAPPPRAPAARPAPAPESRATMRPSRAERARSEAAPAKSQGRREFDTPRPP